MKLFKLKGREVVPEDDQVTWASWYETATQSRVVARTLLKDGRWVSTVFLGIDHGFGSGPPLLFETMVFKDDPTSATGRTSDDDQTLRYGTWNAAEHGHAQTVARLGGAAVHQPPSILPTPGELP